MEEADEILLSTLREANWCVQTISIYIYVCMYVYVCVYICCSKVPKQLNSIEDVDARGMLRITSSALNIIECE